MPPWRKPRRSALTWQSAIPRRSSRRRSATSHRAKYLYWLFFAPGCIEPAIAQIATKMELNPVAAGWGDAQRVFDVLEAALEEGPWILGEQFSAADIAIGSGLNFAVRNFKMVPSRPAFDRYLDRCSARPAFQRAMEFASGEKM